MRLAVVLGGTDWGRSGIGTYMRALLPRLGQRLADDKGSLIAIGTRQDFAAYADELGTAELSPLASLASTPAASALWHLAFAGARARSVGADVLLLPAANRRVTVLPPLPTVGIVPDLAQFTVRNKYGWLRSAYVRRLLPRVLASFDALVAISQATLEDMARVIPCPRQKLHVVPLGVDTERFTVKGEAVAQARCALGLQEPYLLYPARLEHPGKNHLRLLRAYAASPPRHSHLLALSGDDWGAEKLIRREIDTLGLGNRVRLLGHVADPLLPGLFAGARAIVMVGLHEGFGLPAIEALAAGRPVVAARAGALPEVVGELGILCDPLDVSDMASALARAATDDAFTERVSREGPRHAGRWSWDRTCAELLAVCHTVAIA
jgi:glycosyltransferase involved in cell wall biosynthesis